MRVAKFLDLARILAFLIEVIGRHAKHNQPGSFLRVMQALQRGILSRESAKGCGIHHQQYPPAPSGQVVFAAFQGGEAEIPGG